MRGASISLIEYISIKYTEFVVAFEGGTVISVKSTILREEVNPLFVVAVVNVVGVSVFELLNGSNITA